MPLPKYRPPEMHQRRELEEPLSLREMRAIVDVFANEASEYSNSDVRRRIGLAKTIAEEFLPLYWLAQQLPNFVSARLTAQSHPGPDAVVHLSNEAELTVQITTAGESESTSLQRELLDMGEPVFASQSARRVRPSRNIEGSGRVLSNRRANTELAIRETADAVERKIRAYRLGTQLLLVLIRQTPLTMERDWQYRFRTALAAVPVTPYEAIYVATSKTCFKCIGA